MNEVAIGIWQFVGSLALLYVAFCAVCLFIGFVIGFREERRKIHRRHERNRWYVERPWIERR